MFEELYIMFISNNWSADCWFWPFHSVCYKKKNTAHLLLYVLKLDRRIKTFDFKKKQNVLTVFRPDKLTTSSEDLNIRLMINMLHAVSQHNTGVSNKHTQTHTNTHLRPHSSMFDTTREPTTIRAVRSQTVLQQSSLIKASFMFGVLTLLLSAPR